MWLGLLDQDSFQLYADYAANFRRVQKQLTPENARLTALLVHQPGQDRFNTLAFAPLQRPARWLLLVKEILKATPTALAYDR